MKRFLAIYIGTEAALEKSQWNEMDEQKRKALEASGVAAWMEWGKANSAESSTKAALLGRRSAPL
jgi:hypothetical protein